MKRGTPDMELMSAIVATASEAKLPMRLIAKTMKVSGVTLASWKTKGVPPSRTRQLKALLATLTELLNSGKLPATPDDLMWHGVNHLSLERCLEKINRRLAKK